MDREYSLQHLLGMWDCSGAVDSSREDFARLVPKRSPVWSSYGREGGKFDQAASADDVLKVLHFTELCGFGLFLFQLGCRQWLRFRERASFCIKETRSRICADKPVCFFGHLSPNFGLFTLLPPNSSFVTLLGRQQKRSRTNQE